MSAPVLLQPLWSYLLEHWGGLLSYWMFHAIVGWFVYVGVGLYFALKDIGPWRSEATRLHKEDWPTAREILYVGGVQVGVYTLMNVGVWLVDNHSVELPTDAPTVWEFVRDLATCLLVGDFLVYLEHIAHHKLSFLYSKVHYVHHRFKTDLFAWCAGWVHPFETAVFALCEILYPCVLCPVHPLTLWVFECIFPPPRGALRARCVVVSLPLGAQHLWRGGASQPAPHQGQGELWLPVCHLGQDVWHLLGPS